MPEFEIEVYVAPGIVAPMDSDRVQQVIGAVLREEGIDSAVISVAYVADEQIAELNQKYLDHDGPTDVLSFALHEPGEPPHGDIYVGGEQALRQAAEWDTDPAEEWLRLAVHGTLHVLGYDHPEGSERDASPMYRRQEQLLANFGGGTR